ncbi:MAG TPA: RNA polymerase sigma factor [Mycobacteriales bacterium]
MRKSAEFGLGRGGDTREAGSGPGDRSSPRATEEELSAAVHAAQRGDDDAFRVVYRMVQPGLLRYLRVLVGNDAEDVASEAWLQIVRDLGRFRGDADGFRGWAATIGRHRAVDHLRRQQRRPRTGPVDHLVEVPADADTAGSALDAVATKAALALIAALPRDQAEAVLLRTVMGLDAKTAARVLGKRPGAVRTAAYRGLRRLAANLPPPSRDEPPKQSEDPRDPKSGEHGGEISPHGVTSSTSSTLRSTG